MGQAFKLPVQDMVTVLHNKVYLKKNYQLLAKAKDYSHVEKVWTANCKVFVKTKNSKIVQIGSLQDLDALSLPGDVIAGGDATSTPARTRDEVTQPHWRGQGRRGRGSVRGGSRRPYRRRGPGSSNRLWGSVQAAAEF